MPRYGRGYPAPASVRRPPLSTLPAPPLNLRVTASAPTTVTVEWDEPFTGPPAGYGVYLDGVSQGPDQGGRSFTFDGLVEGASYLVEVDASDGGGERSERLALLVTTPDITDPSPPENLVATAVTHFTITMAWDPASDNVGVAGYGVYLDGVSQGPDQGGLTYLFTGLTDHTEYLVEVDAVDAQGNRSVRAARTITTLEDLPPSAPPGLAAAHAEESLTLTWSASTDDLGVTGYEVLVDGQVVAELDDAAREHTVLDVVPGITVSSAAVRALDTGGQVGAESSVSLLAPYMALASPVYRIGAWAGNVIDEHGVQWVVKDEEGWSGSAPVRARSRKRGGQDGQISDPGLFGRRTVTLSGVAIAPTHLDMLAAQQRLVSLVSPRHAVLLRVLEVHLARQARVRLLGQVEIRPQGRRTFTWTIRVQAKDPRRYALLPTRGEAVIDALPGAAETTVTLAGTNPYIPGVLWVWGPIRNFRISHAESGGVLEAAAGVEIPADSDYSVAIDLASRSVTAYVPTSVWPEPRPGRGLLAHPPAWFTLQPGPNTLLIEGEPIVGAVGSPRLAVETRGAWS
ncbi:fibronectin type III domain-containing protein [Streptosporangium sp. NPDC048865]|uniref:fibronectin type III domain-containing protein n=1 Tax=Streptosporangium sp. NPDC048865 TaxID=3155766 RepID=UPI003428116B